MAHPWPAHLLHPLHPPTLCAPSPSPQVHEAIRADPAAKPAKRSKPAEAKRWKEPKLTYDQVRAWVLAACRPAGWRWRWLALARQRRRPAVLAL